MSRAGGGGAVSPGTAVPPPSAGARRYDIDRLRILAVLLLLPFHTARVFNTGDTFYVKNAQESPFLQRTIIDFLDPWHMPLLFALAGAATWFALGHRGGGGYIRERTRRLLVPFVFGFLVIVPPQPFVAQLPHADAERSYLGFLGSYFTNVTDLSGYDGGLTPAHLWFVLYLFLISLVVLPLLLSLRRAAAARDVGRPWMFVAVPFAMLVGEGLPSPEGAWNIFVCLVVFVAGFLLLSSERLQDVVRRRWRVVLLGGVVTMAAVYAVNGSGLADDWTDGSIQEIAFQVVESSNTWLWVLGLIGAAGALLDRPPTPALRYASEAAYPWYVLHQTVIVLVAYPVVGWDLGIAPKYVAILVASTALTFGSYELLVRRWNPVRFLFGLKPRSTGAREAVR